MRICSDEKVLFVREAFGNLGEVVTAPGRSIDSSMLQGADVLVTRTVTPVNESLLAGTGVRFVGSATIGEDHVDKEYLARKGIGFSSAPGCNANAVADYIVAALLTLAERFDFCLKEKSLGIVGVGNVGSRVQARASALQMAYVLNDPPLQRETGDSRYRPIDEIFRCDIVTLHVPLTYEGPDATHYLVDEAFLAKMQPGSILINTSRGSVVDNKVVEEVLTSGHLKTCVIDVWENEPTISTTLLDRIAIGTSHIAGYSVEGKANATRQVYEAARRFFNEGPAWDPGPLLSAPPCPKVVITGGQDRMQAIVRRAVQAVYDIEGDDASLRAICGIRDSERGPYFDRLRNEYTFRREFSATKAILESGDEELASCVRALGFRGA